MLSLIRVSSSVAFLAILISFMCSCSCETQDHNKIEMDAPKMLESVNRSLVNFEIEAEFIFSEEGVDPVITNEELSDDLITFFNGHNTEEELADEFEDEEGCDDPDTPADCDLCDHYFEETKTTSKILCNCKW